MYRLIEIRSLSLIKSNLLRKVNIYVSSNRNYVTQSDSQCFHQFKSDLSKCSSVMNQFCRYNSTTTPPTSNSIENVKPKKKRRKLKYAKYVELLQVTNLSTKQIRAKVKNLKAKKLTDFIIKSELFTNHPLQVELKKMVESKKTNKKNSTKIINLKSNVEQPIEYQKINLDMFDNTTIALGNYDDRPLVFFGKGSHSKTIGNPNDVKIILKSLQNFKEMIETLEHENEQDDGLIDNIKLNENLDENDIVQPAETVEILEEIPIKKSELRYKSKFHNSLELENQAKFKSLIINLKSYLNVCVSTGMLNRSLSTLLTYHDKLKKLNCKDKFNTVDLYNIVLHGFAAKCNFDKIEYIYQLMEDANIAINHQSFAAIFECLGRLQESNEILDLIKKYQQKADALEISFNMIADESIFHYDQREFLLNAMRRIEPNFVPIYTPPNRIYTNSLLNGLNDNIKDLDINSNISTKKKSKPRFSQETLKSLAKEQLEVELAGSLTVKSIENAMEFENYNQCRVKMNDLLTIWRSQICAAINRDINTLKIQIRFKPHGAMSYYTYLKSLDTGQYADILIDEIRMLAEGSETYSPTVSQLFRDLGKKVQIRYNIEQKKRNGILNKIDTIYENYCSEWDNNNSKENSRQIWQRLVHQSRSQGGPSMNSNDSVWPYNALIGVGRFLYNILMRDIKIDANIMRFSSKTNNSNKQLHLLPAFYTIFRNQGKIVKEEVKPHPVLARLLRASKQKTLTFPINLIPMVCPPQPWNTPINGGYLLTKSDLIRLPQQAVQQWSRIESSSPSEMYPSLDSLNQLSNVPWRVNTEILDVILTVFSNGGDSKLDVPQPPSSLPPLPSIDVKDPNISNAERAILFRKKMGHRRKQSEMYSLWCDCLYRLSLANHFRDRVFWLPHNMDFRGRVYPIPPHLNHLGSDLARSLLVFDEAKPLGVDGFAWLKLHCINLTGLKKRDSIRERLLFAAEVMEDILDSAENPLNGRKWWTKSDEPWQTLACCMEIAKVSKCKDPENFMSRFPIHQDGSCNGLQHYAALGRDKIGATSVNLMPSNLPQDVYTSVASLVEQSRKTDAENGLHVAQILDGYVRRKVIKQTVMTTVYGVTRYGARLQIAKQLKDIDEFPKEWVWPASTYLTTKTFESLREMFTSTKEIQDWLTDCARVISTIRGQNVEWKTPLGLPIVQPYNRIEQKLSTKSSAKTLSGKISMDMYEKPNVMKQKNAFPPNFIHSLDSSHMMLTSLHCERIDLTFISVHDCFWTHAVTVPEMNKICREQFVALHSQPILDDLSKFLVNQFGEKENDIIENDSNINMTKYKLNKTLGQLPKQGDFDLTNVLHSTYFFS